MIIAPQTGVAFKLAKGDLLTVIDPEGEQVSDLYCFAADDLADALSSGRSIDYSEKIYFTKGDRLYAASGRVMLTIVEDDCGRHDFLITPCSQQMFEMISGRKDYHPSCLENLQRAFGVSQIGTTFNIFMNVPVSEDGQIRVLPPLSRAGDKVVFRAEMDLLVGLTACSDEGTNNGRCKSIRYEIEPFAAQS